MMITTESGMNYTHLPDEDGVEPGMSFGDGALPDQAVSAPTSAELFDGEIINRQRVLAEIENISSELSDEALAAALLELRRLHGLEQGIN